MSKLVKFLENWSADVAQEHDNFVGFERIQKTLRFAEDKEV